VPAFGRRPSPLAAPEKFVVPYPFAGVIRGVSSVAVYFPGVIRPGPASGSMSPLILSGLILSGLARRGEMILSEIASFLNLSLAGERVAPETLIYNGVFPFRRKLADISRSTRGVVVLLSDRPAAVRILEDAKRLNMMDGHFVWLWVDTAANISISDDAAAAAADKDKPPNEDRYKRSVVKSDISDMHVNYLLKNDQFLLFNRNYGVESSKFKDRNDRSQRLFSVVDGEFKGELPAGLLSLKPLPVRVDRHLVKGAVRLLIATLKLVLHRSPLWMLQSIAKGQLTTSCWKPLGAREYNFSNNFGR
jgi:hypothetical protein